MYLASLCKSSYYFSLLYEGAEFLKSRDCKDEPQAVHSLGSEMWKQATMFCTGEVLLMAETDTHVCAASGLSGNCRSWFLALHLGSLQHRKIEVAEHALLSHVVQKLCNLSASQCSCAPCTCAVPPWWSNTWKTIQMWAFLRPALHWNLRMNESVAQVSSLHGYEMKKLYVWLCVMSLVPTTHPHYRARHSEGPHLCSGWAGLPVSYTFATIHSNSGDWKHEKYTATQSKRKCWLYPLGFAFCQNS